MQTHSKCAKLAGLVIVGSLLLSLNTLAKAESDAARAIRASAANIPTNIPGVHTYAEPPKGFNPLEASDVELATYGFPPRPDREADANRYAQWEGAMKAAKIRWNGELKPLPGGGHGMSQAGSSPLLQRFQPLTTGPKQIVTNNASGVILTNTLKAWNSKTSFDGINANITVPKAQVPFSTTTCTASDYTEVSFVGIDGYVFNTGNGEGFDPMLQGGVYADVNCAFGTSYYAYFAWTPGVEGEFQLNPGDVLYVQVQAFGPTFNSSVFLEDLTTQTSGSYMVSTPGIVGNSANFMVARLCCVNNVPYPLPNTVSISFDAGAAGSQMYTINEKLFYPGSQATSTEILTMTDDLAGQHIESVNQGSAGYQGLHSLYFKTEGCAYSGGCTP